MGIICLRTSSDMSPLISCLLITLVYSGFGCKPPFIPPIIPTLLPGEGAGTTAAGCPAGYDSKDGDIPGWGQIRGRINTTMEGCSEECNKQEGCCSYEFSYSSELCNLNKDCQPSQPKYLDYHFCTKGE